MSISSMLSFLSPSVSADDGARDGRAATARRRGDEAAECRAAQAADGRLGVLLDRRAPGRSPSFVASFAMTMSSNTATHFIGLDMVFLLTRSCAPG